jgi:hypothetical protein
VALHLGQDVAQLGRLLASWKKVSLVVEQSSNKECTSDQHPNTPKWSIKSKVKR